MYDRSSSLILRWLKVPPEPHAPFGDPASLRVFRAGKNYFNFKLAGWALAEAFALAGIIFWAVLFIQVEQAIEARRQAHQAPVKPTSTRDFAEYIEKIGAAEKPPEPAVGSNPATPAAPTSPTVSPATAEAKPAPTPARDTPRKKRPQVRINGWTGFKLVFVELGMWLPAWSFPLLWGLKILGFAVYLVQIPFTYALMRLDYEMRWYVVTDRSLRIRTGVWNIQELTMSFANLQQVVVTRGPIQGLLKISDVRVQSAGGGGGGHPSQQARHEALHTGHFHGVDNADEIRDLILARLKHFREAGLGDPEELRRAAQAAYAASAAPAAVSADLLAAARELAAEAKALRAALG